MTAISKPAQSIDFASLPWNLNLPDEHVYLHLKTDSEWTEDHLKLLEDNVFSYADKKLSFFPATTSLNYGTTIWEGLKAYRTTDEKAAVFRADQNYERMKNGAFEMGLPMPSKELFMRAIQIVVQRNSHLIPPSGEGMKLYVRPMLLGTGQQLGLYPSPQFSFLVYVSPTGNYFKSATTGLNIHLETRRARATPGGVGNVKCAGNYGIVLRPLLECKKHGFHDNLFLELETYTSGNVGDTKVQEMSAANVFLVLKTGEIVTPALERGTILQGVTRDSVLKLVEKYTEELKPAMEASTGQSKVFASSRDVAVKEFKEATEAFCTGTAAELVPIMRIATAPGEEEFDVSFPHGNSLPGGPVTSALLVMLREAMLGKRDISKEWLRDPFDSKDSFCK